MDHTSRLALDKPVVGDPVTDLRAAIAANADSLDQSVSYDEGPISARPTSTIGSPGLAGRLYRATDETGDPLYIDNGTGWNPISEAVVSAFIASLLDDADEAEARATLGAVADAAGATIGGKKISTSDEAVELKTIRGRINTAGSGTILQGTGFTITRNGAGDVTINFTSNFSGVPAVTATVEGMIGQVAANKVAPTVSAARVLTTDSGTPTDEIFDFIAVGPR